MKKVIQSLQDHRLPVDFSRSDWKEAVFTLFGPYFRRQVQLRANIDSFMIELRNLARFSEHPEHMALMEWCLALHRRVLRVDRAGAYKAMHQLFPNMAASDERWINIFQMTNRLGSGAAAQDLAFQLFGTIDGIAEGCFKPQLQIIYSFATRDTTGVWPQQVTSLDFGALVANFPASLRAQVPILLSDPDLNIPVNQWRNIAAHKSFKLAGPQTIQVTYGKGNIQTARFGLQRLRNVSRWLIKTHSAARLANTITFVEHMREIVSLGQPVTERPLSTTVLGIGHGLSTIGFEVVRWEVKRREGILVVRDRLSREPRGALIHASQQLVALSIGVLADVTTRSRITTVSLQLLLPSGNIFGAARVAVIDADAYSLRKISLGAYIARIEWILN